MSKEVLQPQTKNTDNCVTAGKVKKKKSLIAKDKP